MINLDHPCKQTCSGWKQGYERGVQEMQSKLDQAEKVIALAAIDRCVSVQDFKHMHSDMPVLDMIDPKTGRFEHHCHDGSRGDYCFDYHANYEQEKCDEAKLIHTEKVSPGGSGGIGKIVGYADNGDPILHRAEKAPSNGICGTLVGWNHTGKCLPRCNCDIACAGTECADGKS